MFPHDVSADVSALPHYRWFDDLNLVDRTALCLRSAMDTQREREREVAFDKYHKWLLSDAPFPVNATELNGVYSRKDTLKECLETNFILNTDYIITKTKTQQMGRPVEHIFLSIRCLKELLIMQRTVLGKRFRKPSIENSICANIRK